MQPNKISFTDGDTYERYMGKWSQLVGQTFLTWLAPSPGWRWLDVGCGNGAFTELIASQTAPTAVAGIDPSEAQLRYARSRPALQTAEFHQTDATNLPFADNSFDTAVMPLVIFFLPDPLAGVQQMARVVCPGGWVAAYAWDMYGGGFPYYSLQNEMQSMGITIPKPPSPAASRLDVMQELWTAVGLQQIETRSIRVQRSFANFDDYWQTVLGAPSVGPSLAQLSAAETAVLQERVRAILPTDAHGRIAYEASANAIKGQVPA